MDDHKIDYGGRKRSCIPKREIPSPAGLCSNNPILRINVAGRKFELLRSTLVQYPRTRLGIVALLSSSADRLDQDEYPLYDYYDAIKQEYFFQRNPSCFSLVVSYYVNKVLHVPRHLCTQLFQEEMEYWCIPFILTNCCQGYHRQEWETTEGVRLTNQLFEQRTKKSVCEGMSSTTGVRSLVKVGKYTRWRMRTWDLFENSESSSAASWMSLFSSLMVIFSMIILCIGTLPGIANSTNSYADGSNRTAIGSNGADTLGSNTVLYVLEIICITWFTVEYLIRTFTTPNYKDYFLSIMNTIDLLAILPFYITLVVETLEVNVSSKFTTIRKSLQVLRIFRVIRIFKIARHSAGLQVLGYTVKNSMPELGLLLMLLIMGMTLFSSLVYYAEEGENPKFDSIIAAFWWSIISMTTVGYGDMTPQTTFGKIIGSVCCVSGILFIALPIPTIVSNFSSFYKDHRNKEKLNKINTKECAGITTSDLDMDLEMQLGGKKPKSPDEMILGYKESIEKGRALSLTLIERQGSYLRRMSGLSESSIKMPVLPGITEVDLHEDP